MENKTAYFVLQNNPYHKGEKSIYCNHEAFSFGKIKGSFAIMPARVMNLSYPDWLSFCKTNLKAKIYCNGLYASLTFPDAQKANKLVQILNSRMRVIDWEKNNLDWRNNKEYCEKKKIFIEQDSKRIKEL